MPRIFDNITEHLDEALRGSLTSACCLDACVGYFNLRGWDRLADEIDVLERPGTDPKVRLLIGMAENSGTDLRRALRFTQQDAGMDNQTADRLRKKSLDDFRDQLVRGLPSRGAEKALRSLRRQLADGDVRVKLFLRHRLHAKLYLCHRDDHDNPITGYVGSSNLTFAGLVNQGELNVDVLDHDATAKLHRWFEHRWNDQFSVDVTDDLIALLDESWAAERLLDPYLVYLKMAYHLSRDAREGLIEYGLPESMRSALLDFQVAAVQVAARILDRRGGVMIGDVVGLGKTMVATAIARLWQEEKGTEALIICPKNLTEMWKGYVHHYRLHADVLSLSMAARDLPDMRRYRIVVIDESHNLRSSKRKDYAAIKDYIDRNDSKVILLTATPYNIDYSDVANQLALFVGDDINLGIQPDQAIRQRGEVEFLRLCDGKPQTLKAFRLSEDVEDWRQLMSLFLVRRTRRFIMDNYAWQDEAGRMYLSFANDERFYFPQRFARPLPYPVTDSDPASVMVSEATLEAIASLKLPRYSLALYQDDAAEPSEDEEEVLNDLQRALQGNLTGVTRIMLYKRLSSSGAAFILSLQRHLLRNWIWLVAARNRDLLPLGHVVDTVLNDEDAEAELPGDGPTDAIRTPEQWMRDASGAYAALRARDSRQTRWIRCDLFTAELAEALEHDIAVLQRLLGQFGAWRQEDDRKLDSLAGLLRNTHRDDKVVIFTEYRDTAEYVAGALTTRGIESVSAVSGSSEDPTALARRFSPVSCADLGGLPSNRSELSVLVSTDVLSEGQNLQDAHVVINYDLPWAIARIIQRAGRVDRIGQQAPEVFVYSFLPANDVEKVIGLRRRIRRRLRENAVVLGSDEAFFGDDGEQRVIEGLYDEQAHPDDPSDDVDWTSLAYEIWRKATNDDPTLRQRVEDLPDVVYATRRADESRRPGALIYVRTEFGFDALAFTDSGGVSQLMSPADALKRAECEPGAEALPALSDHHDLVAQAVAGPLQTPSAHREGALSGVRKRCWDRLSTVHSRFEGSLFEDGLNDAMDNLYRRPLRESATQSIAKALRERTPENLALLLIQLHQDGRLCVPEEDLSDDDLRIICSMGFRP